MKRLPPELLRLVVLCQDAIMVHSLPERSPKNSSLGPSLCTTNHHYSSPLAKIWLGGFRDQLLEGRVLSRQDRADGFATIGCNVTAMSAGQFSDEAVGSQRRALLMISRPL